MATSTTEKPAKNARASTKHEQREASTEKILASALRLFVSKGYRSATVDDIASACELTKGAVYFYFPTKAAILLALLDEIEEVMVHRMVTRVSQAGPLVADKLIAFLHSGAGTGNEKPALILLFILMLLEFNGAEDEIEVRVKAIYQQICMSVEEVVHRGKLAGEFRTDLETHEIAAIVMAMYNGTFMEWYCRPNYLQGRELVRAAREITLRGILKQPA
ncbi:Nucleoid occlusion factor SlmA [compost metagenome]|uniref:TetR/AcrR family transcriptional regulator n=1 Tax=Polaromonas aquatica TaxID=332657 RepID=A0ABW1TSZ1_9BURK